MKASASCIAICQHFEGLSLKSYPDPKTGADPWTIGYGHTGADVRPGLIWTQQQAEAALASDLKSAESAVNAAVTIVGMSQNQFDALVSIVFNVGPGSKWKDGIIRLKDGSPSTLLKFVNAGNYAAAAEQFLRWISPGSSVTHGLLRRRTAERALFLGQCVESAIKAGDAA
jgi:lysozyme